MSNASLQTEHGQPIYRRILLKLSGEALQGDHPFGIDPVKLARISTEVANVTQLGVQVGLVIGGGNLIRGAELTEFDPMDPKDIQRLANSDGTATLVRYQEWKPKARVNSKKTTRKRKAA